MTKFYSDPLITISDDGVCVRKFGIFGGDKMVPWNEIEKVRAVLPTVWNGRWRLSGSSDLVTWFASDWSRPARETIFILHRRGKSTRIGFTVHDARRVKSILAERGVLVDEQGDALPTPPPVESRPMWQWGPAQAVLVLLVMFALHTAWYYPKLPQQVATHFNAAGHADGWGSKALLTTVMLAAATFVAGLFASISYALTRTSASIIGRYLMWFAVVTMGLLLAIAHMTMTANISGTQKLGLAPFYAMLIYLAAMGAVLVQLFRRLR